MIAAESAGSSATTVTAGLRLFSASETPISEAAVPTPWQKPVTRPAVCSQISRPSISTWPRIA